MFNRIDILNDIAFSRPTDTHQKVILLRGHGMVVREHFDED
jgi:hypothetical protein